MRLHGASGVTCRSCRLLSTRGSGAAQPVLCGCELPPIFVGALIVPAGSLNLHERGVLHAHTVCFGVVVKHLQAESEHESDTELVI